MSGTNYSISALFSSGQFTHASEPDAAEQLFGKPESSFVLCRDEFGIPTAIYGDSVWDFNPYRLSAKNLNRINFETVFDGQNADQQQIIDEVKYILYCLIYFAGGGRRGALSASTISQYWSVLRQAMQFCYAQKEKEMVGLISLKQLFSVPVYLGSFIREVNFRPSVLSGIILKLASVGEQRLGFTGINLKAFSLKQKEYYQHFDTMINHSVSLMHQ